MNGARAPYPTSIGDGKFLVRGQSAGGDYLQVIFVIDPNDAIFVIHARPLTANEKRQLRRRRK